MTSRTRIIVAVGVILFLVAGLYVPWQWWYEGQVLRPQNSTYGWIFAAPAFFPSSHAGPPSGVGPTVEWSRLLVEWIVIAVATAALVYLLPRQEPTKRSP